MERRPSVEDLMMHPRICFVIKALEVRRKDADVKRKEKQIATLEDEITARQEDQARKLTVIQEKETALADFEIKLKMRETQLILQ